MISYTTFVIKSYYIIYHVLPHHVMSYHIMSYHISCHVTYHVMSSYAIYHISCHVISCQSISYHISYTIYHIPYTIYHISGHAMSCHVKSYHILAYIMCCHVKLCHDNYRIRVYLVELNTEFIIDECNKNIATDSIRRNLAKLWGRIQFSCK